MATIARIVRRTRPILLLLVAMLALLAVATPRASARHEGSGRVDVIVELAPPPAARAGFAASASEARAALREVDRAQTAATRAILDRIPSAAVRWRYRIVLDGLAVSLPARHLARLERVPGVVRVYPSVRYRPLLDDSPAQIGAPAIWGPALANAGLGMKIGIVDDGIDPAHPLFAPGMLEMPGGFPKGDRRYTSAKVIVARAFAPAGASWRYAARPFDPVHSFHGVHVAGIAAGTAGTVAPGRDQGADEDTLSGVAPLAYLGNYKVLTVPTESGVGLNGNSPEIVAAIEAAVADGMDVVNLSIGEPDIAPEADAVARALDNAALAGVVPVVSAGNDHDTFGRGSIASPGSTKRAITVAAVTGAAFTGLPGFVVGPEPVPEGVASFAALGFPLDLPREWEETDQLLVDAAAVTEDGTLCGPAPAGSFTGRIVLVRAGACSTKAKARSAQEAGAVGLMLVLQAVGDPASFPVAPLPAVSVSPATGGRLASFVADSGGEIRVRIRRQFAELPSEESGLVAGFSSSGPTPLALRPKPDVAAPGVEVLSAEPDGGFGLLSGTSMAAPHVAGAAALLLELHPEWTVSQVKSALMQTGRPAFLSAARLREAPPPRQGGGIVDLPQAAEPLLFAEPQSLGFGLLDVRAGARLSTATVALDDAGGGAGTWNVSVDELESGSGLVVGVPATATVPGALTVSLAASADAAEGEGSGYVVLEREGVTRRIPYWLRVTRPRLPSVPTTRLAEPGVYEGDNSGGAPRIDRYRYPEAPIVANIALRGPEQAFRLVLPRPAANLGVAVLHRAQGVSVQARIVRGADENRLAGLAAIPYVGNPYLPSFLARSPIAGVLFPAAGPYTIVFDSPRPRQAGAFRFRVWIGDTRPPTVRLLSHTVRDGRLLLRVRDRGSGVDPAGILYSVDGGPLTPGRLASRGLAELDLRGLRPGRHRLQVQVSDRQETKNNENVSRALQNTRTLSATVTVPRR